MGSYYGTSSQPLGHFAAYTDYFEEATKGNSQLFNKKDCRAYESAQSTNGINVSCIFRRVETYLHMALCCKNLYSMGLPIAMRRDSR